MLGAVTSAKSSMASSILDLGGSARLPIDIPTQPLEGVHSVLGLPNAVN